MTVERIKQYISRWLREKILKHYLVPYSRFGLDAPLVRWWKPAGPVTVIDVGACFGGFMESVAAHFEIERALLIEPLPHRCEQLRARFPQPVFEVAQCAVADSEGFNDFYVHAFDYASSLLRWQQELDHRFRLDMSVEKVTRVKTTTLDALAESCEWHETIDLLKIDVQGAELPVLTGAQETLQRVEHVFVELAFREMYRGGCTFDEVYRFLVDRGFQLLEVSENVRDSQDTLEWVDALFRRKL